MFKEVRLINAIVDSRSRVKYNEYTLPIDSSHTYYLCIRNILKLTLGGVKILELAG